MKLDIDNIDKLITYWRKQLNEASVPTDKLVARCYIDAFQTVRVNHGLDPLPKE